MVNFILICVSILFFICGLIFLCGNFYHIDKKRFDFKNHYLYELIQIRRTSFYLIGVILLLLSLFANIAVFVNLIIAKGSGIDQSLNIVFFLACVIGIFMIIPIILISIFNMSNYRYHLFGDLLFILFSILLSVSLIIISGFTLADDYTNKSLIILIISCITTLISLILCFNPSLLKWYKLEEVTLEDGSKEYKRPKWFALCYSEWSLYIIYYINTILLIAFMA